MLPSERARKLSTGGGKKEIDVSKVVNRRIKNPIGCAITKQRLPRPRIGPRGKRQALRNFLVTLPHFRLDEQSLTKVGFEIQVRGVEGFRALGRPSAALGRRVAGRTALDSKIQPADQIMLWQAPWLDL